MTNGKTLKADIVIYSALGANFSPNAIVTNGSAIAARPIKIGVTITDVIATSLMNSAPTSVSGATREKLGTTIELIELIVT